MYPIIFGEIHQSQAIRPGEEVMMQLAEIGLYQIVGYTRQMRRMVSIPLGFIPMK